MSLRSDALENETTHKFIDAISLDLMNDPVIASDGFTYERESILEWFKRAKEQQGEVLSPCTGAPLANETLTPNIELKAELDAFKACKSSIRSTDLKFTLSSEIYKELDRISQIPQLGELNLKPPKIIVVGNESHGKSTLLERIVNLPLFPKDKGICTRCIIRVHLRRCLPKEPNIAEVSILRAIEGKNFRRITALDNIREKIQEAMQFLIDNDRRRRMIIDDNEVVVTIKLPYVLNVDILDLPGLVTTAPESSGQNLPEVTKRLASRIVMENKDCSIFLLVNDIRVPPNQSRGCEVIQECKVQSKTLGVFTKIDAFVSEEGDEEEEELKQHLQCKADSSFSIGYGWMAASSKKISDGSRRTSELQAILNMENRERMLFEGKYARVHQEALGIFNIRQKVQNIYESFISEKWIPHIQEKLQYHREKIEDRLFQLGVPLAAHPSYRNFPVFRSQFRSISLEAVQARMNAVFKDIGKDFEELFSRVAGDDVLWSLLEDYCQFFQKSETKWTPYNFSPVKHSDLIGREISIRDPVSKEIVTAKILNFDGNSTFNVERISEFLVGEKVQIDLNHSLHNQLRYRPEINRIEKGIVEGTIHSILQRPPKISYQIKFERSNEMFYSHGPNYFEGVTLNMLIKTSTVERKEIISGLEGVIFTKEDHIRSLLQSGDSRLVPFDQVNTEKGEMKKRVKDRLTAIFSQLQTKLNPNPSQLRNILLQYDEKWHQPYQMNGKEKLYPFKIERFPRLLQTCEAVLSNRLNELRSDFEQWFATFLRQAVDEVPPSQDFIAPEFIRTDGKVFCYLHWTNREMLEKLPHLILAKWSEITPERFGAGLLESLSEKIDMSMFTDEPCREERLRGFNELKDIDDLTNDVASFARKVSMTSK